MKTKALWMFAIIFCSTPFTFAQNPLVWSFSMETDLTSSPLIHNDVLYIGNYEGDFYALNSVTGAMHWQFKADGQIRCKAAMADNVICMASGTTLYGLSLQGEALWQFTLCEESRLYFFDYHHCSPYVFEGIVYIGTEKGHVYGVNAQTGEEVFHCQTPDGEHVIRTTPAIAGNFIFFGNWDGVFFAYDLTTAEQVWSYDTKEDQTFSWDNSIQDAVAVHNNIVYFAGKGCVIYALNPENGEKVWSYRDPTDQWLIGGPAISGDLLVQGSSNQYELYGHNANTGEQIWVTQVDHRIFDAPLIGETHVFASSGSFYAINKETGLVEQRFNVDGELFSTPALNHGMLYFGTARGTVYALDYEKFINKAAADITLNNEDDIDFGEVSVSNANAQRTFTVYNRGEGPDSLWITNTGSRKIKDALYFEPAAFYLAAGDSQGVTISVDADGLSAKSYSSNMTLNSTYRLDLTPIKRKIKVEIVESTDVRSETMSQPRQFVLHPNFPNPFNPSTTLHYELAEPARVQIQIFDLQGRQVAELVNANQNSGPHVVHWDGREESSGMYVVRMNIYQKGQMINYNMKIMLMK